MNDKLIGGRMKGSPSSQATKPCYSIPEVENILGISHGFLYQLINAGKIRTFKLGKRRFVSAEALAELISTAESEAA